MTAMKKKAIELLAEVLLQVLILEDSNELPRLEALVIRIAYQGNLVRRDVKEAVDRALENAELGVERDH